ncbi:unnamed protein product [Chilo suppressalis]|uniref:Uncharacterized protein n=1 Tax=Chilo suppressalis TaxID=168631 RepID=A0ABN8BAY1_CHISP|nr:unnamed protein product [Chilo suppressalis]
MCDGVDHCADGSDEDTATLCPESGGAGVGSTWVLAGAGGALLLALLAANAKHDSVGCVIAQLAALARPGGPVGPAGRGPRTCPPPSRTRRLNNGGGLSERNLCMYYYLI